jgi:serine protease AprX
MRLNCGSRNTSEATRRSSWIVMVVVALVAMIVPVSASADSSSSIKAFVTPTLLASAQANPTQIFDVIVQGTPGQGSNGVASTVFLNGTGNGLAPRQFRSVTGVEANVSGQQLQTLARIPSILAITPNSPVHLTGALTNTQKWPYATGVAKFWPGISPTTLNPPAIAIVDSGVDATRPDLAGRVREQVSMTSLPNNSPGDGRGHGTFVASIAAGGATGYVGAAPTAPLVSIDVADDSGMAMTSDVIAAADWILANKARLNIRVANFSLHSSNPGSFMFDPLNKAVERLWFSGVTVVAAAGNYGNLGRGGPYAPGDDPFVITVGAADISGSVGTPNDFQAPWSAYGYTLDGFAKPELGAPGRYMVGAVSSNATLTSQYPAAVTAPGYMELSGTSFAAPVVSGAAAILLALHPTWTPDQVKGALMLTASPTSASPMALGVGEVDAAKAAALTNPPNPNLALNRFVVADPTGGSVPVFDAASWTSAAKADASWTSASWTDASWTSASWMSASWTSASWTSASWTSASWTSASWTSASWTSASWTSASWTSISTSDASWLSNADSDLGTTQDVSTDEITQTELTLGVDLNGDGIVGPVPAPSN